jgi:hypothetical protein
MDASPLHNTIIKHLSMMSEAYLFSSLLLSYWNFSICDRRIITLTFHQIGTQIMSHPFVMKEFLFFFK